MDIKDMDKSEVITSFALHDKDVGSPEVRVAILTKRIKNLSSHLKSSKKDVHSRKGLIGMINKRRKLLKYLGGIDTKRYLDLINRLELRK